MTLYTFKATKEYLKRNCRRDKVGWVGLWWGGGKHSSEPNIFHLLQLEETLGSHQLQLSSRKPPVYNIVQLLL